MQHKPVEGPLQQPSGKATHTRLDDAQTRPGPCPWIEEPQVSWPNSSLVPGHVGGPSSLACSCHTDPGI